MNRRDFIKTGAAAGAGWMLARSAGAQAPATGGDALNVALVGVGAQGRVLIDAALKIPDIRFKAVCDIWSYANRYGSRYLGKFGHEVNSYVDFDEMLAAETDLDAVLVATPDFVHAQHTVGALKAGLNVYCEKMMADTLENARSMVTTSRETGKLLQVGHQRRSNPRYQAAVSLVQQDRVLGPLVGANAQWNRGKSEDLGWPEKYEIDAATLEKYGYESMHHFRNWRWYKRYGNGPISDLGAHQIDLFSWFYGGNPTSVIASGGIDTYPNHEWYDNVMAIYEYQTPAGTGRAFYQVQTATSSGGYFETFMGEQGTMKISENPRWSTVYREANAPDWSELQARGVLVKPEAPVVEEMKEETVVDVRESAALDEWRIPVELNKALHQPHLENFFDAIRNGTPLTCPGEEAYKTAVAVLAVNQAVAENRKIEFTEDEFES